MHGLVVTEMQDLQLGLVKAHTIGLNPHVQVNPTGVFLKGKLLLTENGLGFNLT